MSRRPGRQQQQVQLDFDSIFGNLIIGSGPISASDIEIERQKFKDFKQDQQQKALRISSSASSFQNQHLLRHGSPSSGVLTQNSNESSQQGAITPKSALESNASFGAQERVVPPVTGGGQQQQQQQRPSSISTNTGETNATTSNNNTTNINSPSSTRARVTFNVKSHNNDDDDDDGKKNTNKEGEETPVIHPTSFGQDPTITPTNAFRRNGSPVDDGEVVSEKPKITLDDDDSDLNIQLPPKNNNNNNNSNSQKKTINLSQDEQDFAKEKLEAEKYRQDQEEKTKPVSSSSPSSEQTTDKSKSGDTSSSIAKAKTQNTLPIAPENFKGGDLSQFMNQLPSNNDKNNNTSAAVPSTLAATSAQQDDGNVNNNNNNISNQFHQLADLSASEFNNNQSLTAAAFGGRRGGRGPQKVVVHARRDVGGPLMTKIFDLLNSIKINDGGDEDDDENKKKEETIADDAPMLDESAFRKFNAGDFLLNSSSGGKIDKSFTKAEPVSVVMGATAESAILLMLESLRKGREAGLTAENVSLFDPDLFELIIAEPDGRRDDEFGFQKFKGSDILSERWLQNVALVPCANLAGGIPRKHSVEFEAAGALSHLPFQIQMPHIGAVVLSAGMDLSKLPPLIRNVELPSDLPLKAVPTYLCRRIFYHETNVLRDVLGATLAFEFGSSSSSGSSNSGTAIVPVYIRQQQQNFFSGVDKNFNPNARNNLLLGKFRLDSGAVSCAEWVENMTLLMLWLYGVRKLVITASRDELSKHVATNSALLANYYSGDSSIAGLGDDGDGGKSLQLTGGGGSGGSADGDDNDQSPGRKQQQHRQQQQASQNVVEMDDAQASAFRTYLVKKINHLGTKQDRQFDVHGAYIYNHLPGTEFGTKNPRRAIADISSLKICADSPIRCIVEYGGIHNDAGVSMTLAANSAGSDKAGVTSKDVLEFTSPDECKSFVSQVNVLRNIQRLQRIRSTSFASNGSSGGAGGGGGGGGARRHQHASFIARAVGGITGSPNGGGGNGGAASGTFVNPTVHAPGTNDRNNKGGFFTKLFS